jgi:hypothetical protein
MYYYNLLRFIGILGSLLYGKEKADKMKQLKAEANRKKVTDVR